MTAALPKDPGVLAEQARRLLDDSLLRAVLQEERVLAIKTAVLCADATARDEARQRILAIDVIQERLQARLDNLPIERDRRSRKGGE